MSLKYELGEQAPIKSISTVNDLFSFFTALISKIHSNTPHTPNMQQTRLLL